MWDTGYAMDIMATPLTEAAASAVAWMAANTTTDPPSHGRRGRSPHRNSGPVSEAGRGGRRRSEQQLFPPASHLYYSGRLCNIFLNWMGEFGLVVIPHQRVFKMTQFYPIDLAYMFNEIHDVVEERGVRSFTMHIYKHNWSISPHLHMKLGIPRRAHASFVAAGAAAHGIVPRAAYEVPPADDDDVHITGEDAV